MDKYDGRVAALRKGMSESGANALLIPMADPHLSEYIPDHWKILEWLTGFTGSAGTVVLTNDFCGLWTDSRYSIQAAKQLAGTACRFMESSLPPESALLIWLGENLPENSVIAIDGRLISLSFYRRLQSATAKKSIVLRTDADPVPEAWADRPELPASVAFDHSVSFAGIGRSAKISALREAMKKSLADYILLASPDDIMWILNIRGRDSDFNPVIRCFAMAGHDQVLLFVDESQLPLKLARELDSLGVVMLPYEETEGMLSVIETGSSLLIDPDILPVALYLAIPEGVRIIEEISAVAMLRSVKNLTEIENIGRAMIRDGAALEKYLFLIDKDGGSGKLTERSAAVIIDSLRASGENFVSSSFETITAWRSNSALPHYRPSESSDSCIEGDGILLTDSGAHYLDGTTDVTRTVAIGIPSERQKRDFTLVLKGLIALSRAKFPEKTRGVQLDILARSELWKDGLNYGHGTGHGVGFCLNVHERPFGISPARRNTDPFIVPGVLLSNEPAVYREGKYGIRTENLLLCCEDHETENGIFFRFETLTLCHIDKNLIDFSILDRLEKEWLNSYHAEVYDKLSPLLTGEEKQWLREKTSPE
jgi:Xaa-Pro aminopeptidase